MEITDERIGDIKVFKNLVNGVEKVKKVLGDSAYDSRESFEFLSRKGIERLE